MPALLTPAARLGAGVTPAGEGHAGNRGGQVDRAMLDHQSDRVVR
ncbi:hypothetical protein AB0A74_09405 [Saccharothrix sp. NPDC042600]